MQRFAALIRQLDQSQRTRDKLAALAAYFSSTPPADAAWATFFLSGGKLPSRLPAKRLRAWVSDRAGLPQWLVDECYERVGDLAETAAILVPNSPDSRCTLPLHRVVEIHIQPLHLWDDGFQRLLFHPFWVSLNPTEAFAVNKMLTGGFRLGVSKALLQRGIAQAFSLQPATVAHRMMGDWQPTPAFFTALTAPESTTLRSPAQPYPFFLASPIATPPDHTFSPSQWLAEWKWDGIRAQLIRRDRQTFLWSRGDESLNDAFPDLVAPAAGLPDGCVLDGEILCWQADAPLPFHTLQSRLNRINPPATILNTAPACFMAFDCLEFDGVDLRSQPLTNRLAALDSALAHITEPRFRRSQPLPFTNPTDLAAARERARQCRVEGLMLKALDAPYQSGRVRGSWWKWKVDPLCADLVLIYAQAGHGRRAGLFTDYTFAAWHNGALLPVAKAYSGLNDADIRLLDQWIKANTIARKGPVRTVPPTHVFEIAFEGVRPSNRHRAGLALRFPRILRWRTDKPTSEADSIASLQALIT